MPQRSLEARRALAPARAKEPDATLAARIIVRDATDPDVPAIVRLVNDAYRPVDWWIFERARVRDEAEYRDEVETKGGHGVVVEFDGAPVAHAAMWFDPAWSPGTAWVGMFATAPHMQGRGIGTILMREAERRARGAGFDRLRLDCVRENGMPAYYESLGFGVDSEERRRGLPHVEQRDAAAEWTLVNMSKELR
jgi:GNAT superfamily N-acetyltransferase